MPPYEILEVGDRVRFINPNYPEFLRVGAEGVISSIPRMGSVRIDLDEIAACGFMNVDVMRDSIELVRKVHHIDDVDRMALEDLVKELRA